MDDVARYPNLLLRNGTYYHQVRVPADIADSYGRKIERRSLKTKNLKEAAAQLAAEDQRVQRLFEEHRATLNGRGGHDDQPTAHRPAPPQAGRMLDIAAIARRHAQDVTDREHEERAACFAELQRRIEADATAEALFRGEIIPLPKTDYLDHVLSDGEIEIETALAVILRERLKVRLKDLRLAITIGNLIPVAAAVEAEAPDINGRERLSLARALMRAEIDALEAIRNDATHVDVEPPLSPVTRSPAALDHLASLEAGPQPKSQLLGPLLSVVSVEWMAEKERTQAWVEKTRYEREAAVRSFIEVCGDKSIGSYRKADVRQFKHILFSIPPNAHKKAAYRGKTLREIAEVARAASDKQPSAKNVGLKMDAVASLFHWARQNYDEVSANPFEGVKPKIDTAPREERDPFTLSELQMIFAMPPFKGAQSERNWLSPGSTVLHSTGKYWVPLIALFTGARLMEIVQLRKCDVRTENGITFLDLNDEDGKRVKTKASRRRIPIHTTLLAAGLMEHVASIRRNEDRLFSDIGIGPIKNRSAPASKLFARLFEAANVKTGKNCFHSFRHTFEDACRSARIDTAIMNALQGHAEKGMAARYGSGYPLDVLSSEISKIAYKGLSIPCSDNSAIGTT